MSLLRLLTAGKSLVGLKKVEGRYQLPSAKSLPQFGSKKNPFRATVFPDKSEGAGGEPVAANSCSEPKNGTEAKSVGESGAPKSDPPTCSEGSASLGPRVPEPAKDTLAPSQPEVRRTGLKALLLWGRAAKFRSSRPLTSRPMVQGELSLDSVKVVRNDLAESDLEVVQARPAPRPALSVPEQPGQSHPQPELPAGRGMVGRLLAAGKM